MRGWPNQDKTNITQQWGDSVWLSCLSGPGAQTFIHLGSHRFTREALRDSGRRFAIGNRSLYHSAPN
jgi:hypothetical protein